MIGLIGGWITGALATLAILLPTAFFWTWVFGLVGLSVPGWAWGAVYVLAVVLHTVLILGVQLSSE